MIRHPRRSVPASIVALLVLSVCVATVVSVVQSLLGRAPWVSLSTLLGVTSTQQWNAPAVVAAAVVLAVLGLVLLLAAIRPGKPTVMPLVALPGANGSAMADAGVRRASLAKDLAAAAGSVPGVTKAVVHTRRSRVLARVTVAASDPATVPGQVREHLENRLAEIGPAPGPRVEVRARRDTTT